MMCQRSGRPPTSTIGFGLNSVSSRRRVPKPPHRITTFIRANCSTSKSRCARALAAVPLDRRSEAVLERRLGLEPELLRRARYVEASARLAVGLRAVPYDAAL